MIEGIECKADVRLVPVETVQMGLMGQTPYEGVEVIAGD